MNLMRILAATTALTLACGSAALADENFSNVVQSGNDNAGEIVQGPGTGNSVGTEDDESPGAATQAGDDNIFEFDQTGSDNAIGTEGEGFRQDSNRNSAFIIQSSSGNTVREVRQTGIDSSAGGVSLRRNTLTIEQRGHDGNTITSVTQMRTSGFFTNGRPGNEADIVQNGSDNTITDLLQDGRGNDADVTQTGNENVVNFLSQEGTGNVATVDVLGNGNITDINQIGLSFGNFATTTIANGNDNEIMINQWSAIGENEATATITDGDDNNVEIVQTSLVEGNNTRATITNGDNNDVLINQSSLLPGHEATVTIENGGGNLVDIFQTGIAGSDATVMVSNGNDNEVLVEQEGFNRADIGIVGSRNFLDVEQDWTLGGANTLNLDIWGDDNNNAGSFSLSPSQGMASAAGLSPGRIVQEGSGNEIDVDVGGPTEPESSDQNLFAFSQTGNGNTITGQVVGVGNEVAVVQDGDNNAADFTQIGNNNSVGISQ